MTDSQINEGNLTFVQRAQDEHIVAVPIACSLSADEARDRLARWKKLVLDAKTSARAQAGLVQAEFRNEAAVRNELEQ